VKRIICDHCGGSAEPNAYGMAPLGSSWMTIQFRKDTQAQIDVCSIACAQQAIAARMAAAQPPTPTCPDCGSVLTPRTITLSGAPTYCETCDREVTWPTLARLASAAQ
jgi:hypothetical protein